VDKPGLLGGESLSEGIASLSEAGVDDFVSSLLVSPARSSAQQSGFSGPLSDEKVFDLFLFALALNFDLAYIFVRLVLF
jgi:hypothetical protein